jgi:dolichol-phosphate mannosyltransferase
MTEDRAAKPDSQARPPSKSDDSDRRGPDISVVISARDEAEALSGLIAEVHAALAGRDHEVVVVDDGSGDRTPDLMARLAGADPRLVCVRHPVSLGQSAAVYSGVRQARGRLVATLDGDGQNDPRHIPELIERLDDPGVGLVAGQRLGRRDTGAKRVASRVANGVRAALLRDGTRDTGCGLKAFRRETFLQLPYFDSMHRFLPALFLADGWRIVHVDVCDRPRQHGQSHYGNLRRLLVGIPDLFGVWWLVRRRRQSPLRIDRDARADRQR